jgi:hypothetical protein
LNVPVAVATPPVIVHDVGTNTAGFSPADDNDTEFCTGMVIDGPACTAADETATVADGGAIALADAVDPDEADAGDGEGEDGGDEGGRVGDVGSGLDDDEVVGAAGGDAFRLPACLPKRNAPTHKPIRTTAPTTANTRWLDGLIDATLPLP